MFIELIIPKLYLGKEVLSIPGVGGWIRGVLDYKWIVIVVASLLVIVGCLPRKKAARKEEDLKAAAGAQSQRLRTCAG